MAGALIDVHCLSEGLWACAALGFLGGGALVFLAVRRHRRGLHAFEGEVTPTPIPLAPPIDSGRAVDLRVVK
jgi:hypothetical protein